MRLLREPWPEPTMHCIIGPGMDTSVAVLPYSPLPSTAWKMFSPRLTGYNLRIERRGRGLRF